MGFGVALGAWVSSRAWGGLAKLTWRVVNGQTKLAVGLAVGLFKKKISFINTLQYLSFFSHKIKHIKHNLAMSSSSYTESSSSSDDGAEIFLQTIATVVKVIVENEEEEEESQQPKRRRRYIARERVTANDLPRVGGFCKIIHKTRYDRSKEIKV
ncbi:hypothetical protein HanRHA438_Chr05g0206291 [Helianthus annuus]|nr:hypothetical protein HanRHA438_Chr05g0206291 [Helianthus annuus]